MRQIGAAISIRLSAVKDFRHSGGELI